MGLPPGGSVEVADAQLCNLDVPEEIDLTTCSAGTNNAGALVTNATLCEAPNDDNICPALTDLEGVYVEDPTTDCNLSPADISIGTNPQVQCLKCADLAAFFGGNNAGQQQGFANLLIGSTTTNIFTICQAANPRPGFNALSTNTAAETAFDNCLDNAAVNPGTQASTASALLQENSLTTNVKPEAEIPSIKY